MSKISIIFLMLMACIQFSHSKPFDDAKQTGGSLEQSVCKGDLDFDCGPGELRARCISSLWICDHIYDCTTGADEGLNCNYLHQCPLGNFMCRNGDCILATNRCNGHQDCLDGSDERACIPASAPKPTRFANGPNRKEQPPMQESPNNKGLHHWAEASSDDEDGNHGTVSVLMVMFGMAVIISLALLATFFTIRRYPHAPATVDQALKEFSRNIVPSRLANRPRNSPPSRVNILSPPNNSELFFDNPMNTLQQPLMLSVANSSAMHASATMTPPSNNVPHQ